MKKRKEGESVKEYLKRVAIKDSDWLKEAKYRRDNEYWLRDSFNISLSVLSFLREYNIEKEDFEKLCGFNLDLHGSYNWTIQEIRKLELLTAKKLI